MNPTNVDNLGFYGRMGFYHGVMRERVIKVVEPLLDNFNRVRDREIVEDGLKTWELKYDNVHGHTLLIKITIGSLIVQFDQHNPYFKATTHMNEDDLLNFFMSIWPSDFPWKQSVGEHMESILSTFHTRLIRLEGCMLGKKPKNIFHRMKDMSIGKNSEINQDDVDNLLLVRTLNDIKAKRDKYRGTPVHELIDFALTIPRDSQYYQEMIDCLQEERNKEMFLLNIMNNAYDYYKSQKLIQEMKAAKEEELKRQQEERKLRMDELKKTQKPQQGHLTDAQARDDMEKALRKALAKRRQFITGTQDEGRDWL